MGDSLVAVESKSIPRNNNHAEQYRRKFNDKILSLNFMV